MDRVAFDEYHQEQRRRWSWGFLAVIAISTAGGLLIGELWSYLAGAAVGAALMLVGWEALARWIKTRWLRRFPELADPRIPWRRG
jgi:hypothetical protein